jgi:NitT/TauT family transport system permease protein
VNARSWTTIAAPVAVGLVFLLLWHLIVAVNDIPPYIVPGPLLVLDTLLQDWDALFRSLLITLQVTGSALLLAVVLGSLLSVLFVQSRLLEAALLPYAVILQVTPLVAIAPLIIIWVDDPFDALVICATVASIFPVIANTTVGLRSVDTGLLDLFRLYGASRTQILLRLRIPSAAPYFFAGLRVATALALIGAVVAEFVAGTGGTRSGLAYQILQAGLQLKIPRLFAALFLITATGVVLFLVVSWLSRLALRRWHESEVAQEDTRRT